MKNVFRLLGPVFLWPATVWAATPSFVSPSGYQLKPAPGWRVDSTGKLHTDVVVYAPALDGFAANLNVKIRPRDEDQTLDGDRSVMNEIAPKMFKDYTLVSQEARTMDGVPVVWTVSTYRILQPAMVLRMYRVEAIRGDKVYYFDAAEPEGHKAKYDGAITNMLQSIHWTSKSEETARR